jgi:hypothetical protein
MALPAGGNTPRRHGSPAGQRHESAGLVKESASGCGQLNPAVIPFEQFGTHGLLQLLDLAAERRLGHVEAFGGPAEVQFLGDGDEAGQLVEGKDDALPVLLDAYLGLDMHHNASLHST